ncbi:hypothetical protein JCM10212_002783 [Sporobolomyces blumeae]
MPAYPYATPNNVLKEQLKLQEHPEGGYFAETDRRKEETRSPFADGASRSLATQIYYLLDAKSPRGKLHLNKSVTYHLHHSGRARYTLLRPSTKSTGPPEIKQYVVGPDVEKGELLQLVVEGGWWKCSELLDEDLVAGTSEGPDGQDRTGCLISEVVVPGFDWHDHAFLTKKGLLEIFHNDNQAEWYQKLVEYAKDE